MWDEFSEEIIDGMPLDVISDDDIMEMAAVLSTRWMEAGGPVPSIDLEYAKRWLAMGGRDG